MPDGKKILHRIAQKPGWLAPDFMFWCPGCNMGHPLFVTHPNTGGSQWTFNGNEDKPTVTPSLVLESAPGARPRCHVIVTDGMLHFLGDCEHEFAGKVVPMVPF